MFRTAQSARLLARIQRLADAAESSQSSESVTVALRLAAYSCLHQAAAQQPPVGAACSGAQRPFSTAVRLSNVQSASCTLISGLATARQLATYARAGADFDDDGDNTEVLTQADFSGLRELLESGEATEEDAVQWLHDNIEKYNIYAQAGEAVEEAAGEMGDSYPSEQEKEEIANSSDYKEAAEWLLTPRPEREPPMRNLAGTGRAGWQLLGVDEEFATPVMALDMTGGQVPNNEQNALLSDEAKSFMAVLAKEFPNICTPAFLAQLFRIRQQRVMAILALKQLEAEQDAEYMKELEADIAAVEAEEAAEEAAEQDAASDQQAAGAAAADSGTAASAPAAEAGGSATSPADEGSATDGSEAAATEAATPAGAGAGDDAALAAAEAGGEPAPPEDGEPGDVPKAGRVASLGDFQSDQELEAFMENMHEAQILAEIQDIAEHDIWECIHAEGSDERHVKLLPSIPRFKEGEDGQLVHDGLTEAQLLMLAEMDAEEEEKHAVAEFKRRLDFNMCSLAPDVQRQSRITRPPAAQGRLDACGAATVAPPEPGSGTSICSRAQRPRASVDRVRGGHPAAWQAVAAAAAGIASHADVAKGPAAGSALY